MVKVGSYFKTEKEPKIDEEIEDIDNMPSAPKKKRSSLTIEEIKAAIQADLNNGQFFQIEDPRKSDWSPASIRDRLYALYSLPTCIVKEGIENNPNIAPDHKQFLLRFIRNRKDFELYYAVAQGLK